MSGTGNTYRFEIGRRVARPRLERYWGTVTARRIGTDGRAQVCVERFCPLMTTWTWRWLIEDELVSAEHAIETAALAREQATPRTAERVGPASYRDEEG